jgi:hypothetical protein
LDAQPAQAERVVRRISRPVWGIGIKLLNQNDQRRPGAAGHCTLNLNLIYGVVGVVAGVVEVSAEFGNGKMNWLPLGTKIVWTPGDSFKMY